MLAGVGQHGPLLLGKGLVKRDGPRRLDGPSPRPGLLLEPAIVTAAGDPKRRESPRRRPAAPLLGLSHFLVDALLQLRGELSVVFQP